jgi:hypothetical protein
MIGLRGGHTRLCDGFSRREFLRLGAISTAGLSLPQLLAATERRAGPARGHARSCILFFLQGGQSQLETFDMKPSAPAQVRGEFRPIATTVPGLMVCEHLPRLARIAHKFGLIRSMTHRASNHNPASYYALTGVPPVRDIVAVGTTPDDYPNPGAVVSRFLPVQRPLPTFVQLSPPLVGDAETNVGGQNAGFLSAAYDPLKITGDPDDPDFDVQELSLPGGIAGARMDRRRSLLATVEEGFPLIGEMPDLDRMSTYYRRAYQLVTSPESRRAFAIHQEPAHVRDRYGRHTYGQSLLLARRLVEAGVRLITVYWGGALNNPDDFWDTHRGNITKQRDRLLPRFDECLSALLEDLDQRGLLDTTLVVSMGEFGRTPRLGEVTANAGTDATGRDHWPNCYTILLAGGGVRGSAIIGRSDAITAYPTDRPTAPEDVIATIYHALGMDLTAEIHDRLGRPLPVTRGQTVLELFS